MKIVSFTESYQEFKPYLSLVLFSKGCNLNCYHCFNYEYINSKDPIGDSIEIITKNALDNPLIEAVTFLGGEPTIWGYKLIKSIEFCKSNNLKTKLFTNGTNPLLLRNILSKKLLDEVSIDLKTIDLNKIINESNNPDIIDVNKYLSEVLSSLNILKLYGVNTCLRCVDLKEDNTKRVKSFVDKNLKDINLVISRDLYNKIIE